VAHGTAEGSAPSRPDARTERLHGGDAVVMEGDRVRAAVEAALDAAADAYVATAASLATTRMGADGSQRVAIDPGPVLHATPPPRVGQRVSDAHVPPPR